MSLPWYLVRNHERGIMKSGTDFGKEVTEMLKKFEADTSCDIDDLLQEEMGAGAWIATGEAPTNYSHPIARIESHGPLTLIILAVPSSLHNGLADFTNLLMLAHPQAVLSIIRDPIGTYSADFGGRLLADYSQHQSKERIFSAGEAVFRSVRSCVLSIHASLAMLKATVEGSFEKLRSIELREIRVGHDLDQLEAEFGRTLAELKAMVRTPSQLTRICGRIEEWSLSGERDGLFKSETMRHARYLQSKVEQVDAMLATFITDIERAIKRCDDVSKRQLLDAQRRNTYWTSALLLPNLIFAFFGQSFLGDAKEGEKFWWISGGILILYGFGSSYFLIKRSRQGR